MFSQEKHLFLYQRVSHSVDLESHYMVLQGRLRLGSMRQLYWECFVKMIFSLGLYFGNWYYRLFGEILLHLDHPLMNKILRPSLTIWIPGIHCFKLYEMSKYVLQMESQDEQKKTQPLLAFFLGIFPPLAMLYLQQAANRHWLNHVYQEIHKTEG